MYRQKLTSTPQPWEINTRPQLQWQSGKSWSLLCISPEPLLNALAAEAVAAHRLDGIAQHKQADRTLVLAVGLWLELEVPALAVTLNGCLARVRGAAWSTALSAAAGWRHHPRSGYADRTWICNSAPVNNNWRDITSVCNVPTRSTRDKDKVRPAVASLTRRQRNVGTWEVGGVVLRLVLCKVADVLRRAELRWLWHDKLTWGHVRISVASAEGVPWTSWSTTSHYPTIVSSRMPRSAYLRPKP